MISKWKEFRLGDITEWASGGTPSKQNADFWNGTIPWISASSMGSNRYNESDLKITPEGLKAGSRLAKKGSILLLVRGSTLHQRIPVGIAASDVSFNQDVKAIKAKEEFIDPWYLLFWFMAKEKDLLNMVENTGIGAGKLDTNRLQNLLIRIPPDSERDKILLFAKALDDKLLLNRQINQTLEAIAQAIFKSWFVEFEPVKSKIAAIEAGEDAEGVTRAAMSVISGKTDEELDQLQAKQPEYYTQLKTTAELFPAAMQDSELGEVPEGWKFKPFGELLSNTVGGDWGKDEPDSKHTEKVLILRGTDLPKVYSGEDSSVPVRYVESKKLSIRKLQPGDIVIEISGGSKDQPTGRSLYLTKELLQRLDSVVEPASFCRLFRPINIEIGLILGLHLMKIYEEGKTWYYQNQSTGISNFQTKVFLEKEEILLPRPELINYFYNQVAPLIQKIHSSENLNLSAIRDALLPKLLSGELSVDAAKLAEE